MTDRFYVPFSSEWLNNPSADPRQVTIEGPEVAHIRSVMRCRPGDEIQLFNGRGLEAQAIISQIDNKSVIAHVRQVDQVDRELRIPIHVSAALPKGDRQKFLIEKLTELGVASFLPLTTSRSIVRPKPVVVKKFQRWVVEASKQCLRNQLMTIHEPIGLESLLSLPEPESKKWLFHPKGHSFEVNASGLGSAGVWLAVGPEGGFTADEIEMARDNKWQVIRMGSRILRVETAAIFAASWVIAHGETD